MQILEIKNYKSGKIRRHETVEIDIFISNRTY